MSRFGLGASLAGPRIAPARLISGLQGEIHSGSPALPAAASLATSSEIFVRDRAFREAVKAIREKKVKGKLSDLGPRPAQTQYQAELQARLDAFMAAETGFGERLVMFWTNHFAVSVAKSRILIATAGAFEREAIRPHIFGRFKDMVLAVETHPAMLQYLDNQKSIGPNSKTGKTDDRGLNENLAREIMELHILGVDSGYSQADVTAFAHALTGWTVSTTDKLRDNGADAMRGDFDFVRQRHEPGPQVVLGETYPDHGFFQAADIMVDLAGRPAAARFISHKLARHFVSDTPPQALVDRLSEVFLDTDGDLAAVSQALIDAPEAWTPQAVKIRTPQEHLIAMLRATGVTVQPRVFDTLLARMGQRMWDPSGPNGYSDAFAAWATPSGLHTRIEAANEIAGRVKGTLDPRAFAETVLGARLSEDTRLAVSRAETMRQGLSLALLSPEFMRR